MKKLTLSLVTILATSTFAIAGGDIYPVEPVVETPMVMDEPSTGGLYVGVGYGYEKLTIDRANGGNLVDEKFGSVLLDAGYKFNNYIGVEGRYWAGINSSNDLAWRTGLPSDITVDAWGVYLKPMFPVTNALNIYGLVGYGSADATYEPNNNITITSDSVTGFSWGVGTAFSVTNNWSVFVDYTSIIDGEDGNLDRIITEDALNTVNVGVNYQF